MQTTDLNTEIYLETYIDPLQPKDWSWYIFFNILTEDMLAKHAIINRPFIDLMHETTSGVPRKARFYWRQCAKVPHRRPSHRSRGTGGIQKGLAA